MLCYCNSMSAGRKCKLHADSFCYVCGGPKQVEYVIVPGTKFCEAYKAYFGVAVGDLDKSWAPHVSCGNCRSTLEHWLRGSRKSMPFAIPRVWREPRNHHDDCYFCMIDLTHFKRGKNRRQLQYPDIPSSRAPVPHSEDLPIPSPPIQTTLGEEANDSESSGDPFTDDQDSKKPHLLNQKELDDLIRDLNLPKNKSELLASRLKEWNFLLLSCRITNYRSRHQLFSCYFAVEESLCYCSNINGLFSAIGFQYEPKEWRLFMDSSKSILKAVLLHNGNQYPSIPVPYSVHLKES